MALKPDFRTDMDWLMFESAKLERFTSASMSSNVYNCRCPICGDSQKKKSKARFYFYEKKGNLNTICHNCGWSSSFWNFVKKVFPLDFEAYKRDQMLNSLDGRKRDTKRSNPVSVSSPSKNKKSCHTKAQSVLALLTPVTDLDPDHAARQYLDSRLIPVSEQANLFYADKFKSVCERVANKKMKKGFPDDERIVIPFYSEDGQIEMIQGRALDPDAGLRYVSIKRDQDVEKIYKRTQVDRSKTVYCCEGPFDSMFVDNCVATCDSNLLRAEADVYIFDNEPRNKDIVELMQTAIENGKSVVIWPVSTNKKIDINDMVIMGMTRSDIMTVIKDHAYHGIRAKLMFQKWRKV